MIKRKFSSKSLLVMSCPVVIMLLLVCWKELISLAISIQCHELSELWISLIILASTGCVLFFILFFVNRFSCIVWVDTKKLKIGRRGLFGGFRYQLDVDAIKEIFVVSLPRQGDYIIVVDNNNSSMEGFSKESYIRIVDTEENRKFIRQVWSGPIVKRNFSMLIKKK